MCWGKMTLGDGAMIKQESVWSEAHPCPNSVILLGSAGKTLHIIKTGYSQEGCFTSTNGTIMFRVASVPHNLKGMDDDCTLSRRERQVPGLQSHCPRPLTGKCSSWNVNPGLLITNTPFFGTKDATGDFWLYVAISPEIPIPTLRPWLWFIEP